MICYAKIVDIDDVINEEIMISIGEFTLVCFCGYMPKAFDKNKIYLCEIDLDFFDNEILEEAKGNNVRIERDGNGFNYTLYGYYSHGSLFLNGLYFDDEFLLDYGYLDNKFVQIKVSRINLNILSK